MSGYVRAVNFVKNFLKGGKQKTTGQTVNPFERKNMRSSLADKIGKLKVAKQDVVGAAAKLNQTIFEAKHNMPFTFNKSKKKTLTKKEKKEKKIDDQIATEFGVRFKKASGGRVGRKFGGGIMTKKSNTQKIQEAFGPKKNKKLSTKQMKIAKLAGNPNKIDAADFAKLRKS